MDPSGSRKKAGKVTRGTLFCQVEMVGQPIGCIVAEDVETARRAAKLVKVEYEKLPAILTMEVSEYR